MSKAKKLQRILIVEIFFRKLADLVGKPFRFIAHLLHEYWVKIYDN